MKRIRSFAPLSALLLIFLPAFALHAQPKIITVPAGTPLPIQLGKHVPMKKGESLTCKLLYPVYAENELAIPAGSILRGSVIALHPDRSHRIHARLWGDFTPFHTPVVRFDRLTLPDGTMRTIVTGDAADGAPVLHLSTPASKGPRSFISRQVAQMKEGAEDTVKIVTAPGRGDRLVQFLYRQLPYHPERIEAETMWTATLAQPLVLKPYRVVAKETVNSKASSASPRNPASSPTAHAKTASNEKQTWHLDAYLQQTISSENEKKGNTFQAVVAEPVFKPDHSVAVPEGSILVGTITQAKPARFFGRTGKLRFDFRELKFPGAPSRAIEGTLAGVNAGKSQQLKIDSEGGVQSQPKNRVIVPVVLTFLGTQGLSDDGPFAANAAVSSNGFGTVGRLTGILSGSRDVAAAIGFYAAGLSVYERWLVRGQNVSFVRNTRIEVTTVPSRNPLPATASPSKSF